MDIDYIKWRFYRQSKARESRIPYTEEQLSEESYERFCKECSWERFRPKWTMEWNRYYKKDILDLCMTYEEKKMWLNDMIYTLREKRNDLRDESKSEYDKGIAYGYAKALSDMLEMIERKETPPMEEIDQKILERHREFANGKD